MMGILSSGTGGFLFIKKLAQQNPGAGFFYWGDTASGEWGSRSTELVQERVENGIRFLCEKNVKVVVMASGDGSIASRITDSRGQGVRTHADVGISLIDYWDAQVRTVEKVSGSKRIGIVGSRLVIDNFEALGLAKRGYTVFKKAIPVLGSLITEGEERRSELRRLVRSHMQWFKTKDVDTFLLGSLRFARVIDDIRAKMGKGVKVVDPVEALLELYKGQEIKVPQGEPRFYLTDITQYDIATVKKWAGKEIELLPGKAY